MKRIVVTGANGNMGRQVVKMIANKDDFELVGAVDIIEVGKDINQILRLDAPEVKITDDLTTIIDSVEVDLIVDFTNPEVALNNIRLGIANKIDMVIGTTGISKEDLDQIKKLNQGENNIIIAPNFAIGAVLMMEFAKKAAKFMDGVEVIDLHHSCKHESPSGTAIKTAELINQNLANNVDKNEEVEQIEKIVGARGGKQEGVNIHSIRLPGLVSHQQVLFGGVGQTLSIKFDSINRESFMPGVEMAIRKLEEIEGVVYGFNNLIDI